MALECAHPIGLESFAEHQFENQYKVIHMIDLADGDLNENSYLEFSGYLNFDATTDGIIYQNVKKAEIDAIRAGNPGYDVFYEVNDPADLLTGRKENEYFYQGKFTRNRSQNYT